LWAFPEPVGAASGYCRAELGCTIAPPRKLDAVEHAFTHFKLRAQPLRCVVRKAGRRAEAEGRMWLDLEEAARAAVPAPVRKLLQRLGRQM
jgi:A/G-specific adenine glycosylase